MRFRVGVAVGAVTAVLSLSGAATAATGGGGVVLRGFVTGGSISLQFAPPNLQACFGDAGQFQWEVTGADDIAELNRAGAGSARLFVAGQIEASVLSDAGRVLFFGMRHFDQRQFFRSGSSRGIQITTPLALTLSGANGRELHVTLNFLNEVRATDTTMAIDYAFALPQYSDITCSS